MALEIVADAGALAAALRGGRETVVLGFFSELSMASRATRPAFERFCADHPDQPAALVDVGVTRDLHARYGVTAVPTVLLVKGDEVLRTIVGVQSPEFYARSLLGEAGPAKRDASGKPAPRRVTVYVTDTCPWCTRVKSYLRQNDVSYDEINVQRDPAAARKMVAKSGQQGVPQIEIDGSMIVGFDKGRIDSMLGLGRGASA
jgi:glutaredoxin-like YruB-family protein